MWAGTSSCWGSQPATFWVVFVGREQLRASSQGKAHRNVSQHKGHCWMSTTEVCWDVAPAGQLACYKPSLKMLLGHLGIMLCKHFSCSPQSESSDTQQSHKGHEWIPRQLFLLPREYLIARCWVRLGLQHLPTFLGELLCREAAQLCETRWWRWWANAKGSICSCWFCQMLESDFCYVGSSVVMDFLCWYKGLAWLGCTICCSCQCAGYSGLKPGAAQLNQCKAVLQQLSCPSQSSLADRAMPLWAPLLRYFLLT